MNLNAVGRKSAFSNQARLVCFLIQQQDFCARQVPGLGENEILCSSKPGPCPLFLDLVSTPPPQHLPATSLLPILFCFHHYFPLGHRNVYMKPPALSYHAISCMGKGDHLSMVQGRILLVSPPQSPIIIQIEAEGNPYPALLGTLVLIPATT